MTQLLLNRNPGKDTIHTARFESCNLDQADDVVNIDAATADDMLAKGAATMCEHCAPVTTTVGSPTFHGGDAA